jgi:AcrR family transcriptional regulator
VSRPTVYQQFGDMPSLVAAATREMLDNIFKRISETLGQGEDLDYVRKLLEMFVEGVYEQRTFSRNAVRGPCVAEIERDTVRLLDGLMREHVIGSRLTPAGQGADDRRAAIAAGLVWMVVTWLDTDFTGSNAPKKFASRLAHTLFSLAGTEE